MDAALLIVTLISLVAALTMSVVAWRVVREDRRRSAARVVALAAEITQPTAPREAEAARLAIGPRSRPAAEPARHARAWREPAADVAIRPVSAPVHIDSTVAPQMSGPSELFSVTQRPVRARLPFAAILLSGVAVVVVIFGGLLLFSHQGGANLVTAAAASPAPLELLALGHTREADGLRVSGLVHNPATGSTKQHVTAVVFLFDRSGTFLASSRARLDFATLAPGDETPFVIKAPAGADVGRYRISFRDDEGRVLPHVDRRQKGM